MKNPTEQKDFLKRGQEIAGPEEKTRRENLIRLVGTDSFPTWKSLSDALGYGDPSRVSHLKSGLKKISPALARGIEEKLKLPKYYFDGAPNGRMGAVVDRTRAARRYLAKKATARALAKEYGVDESLIYKWVAEFRQDQDSKARKNLNMSEFDGDRGTVDLEEENRKLRNKLMEMMIRHDEI